MAQDQSLRLGTHTQPAWAHGSGALAFIPLTHTHTRFQPTYSTPDDISSTSLVMSCGEHLNGT